MALTDWRVMFSLVRRTEAMPCTNWSSRCCDCRLSVSDKFLACASMATASKRAFSPTVLSIDCVELRIDSSNDCKRVAKAKSMARVRSRRRWSKASVWPTSDVLIASAWVKSVELMASERAASVWSMAVVKVSNTVWNSPVRAPSVACSAEVYSSRTVCKCEVRSTSSVCTRSEE
jgi:hypothetical protein